MTQRPWSLKTLDRICAFAAIPLLTHEPQIRFYAGAQLRTAQGFCLGTLCVLDRVPRQLDGTHIQALEALARQVIILLEMRRLLTR